MTAADIRTGRPQSVTSGRQAEATGQASGFLLALFMFSLLIPIHPDLGSLRMDPYRMLLIVLFFPNVFRLVSGGGGRVTASDWLLLGYSFWIVVTLIYNNGLERLPYALAWALELSGGYILGRLLVRNVFDYRRFVKFHLIAILAMAPFAFHELFSGRMVITDFLGQFFPVTHKNFAEARFGLSRVQVVFPHSILFGLFCSLAVANIYHVYGAKFFRMAAMLVMAVAVTFTSLSSAPLLSVMLQTLLTLWDKFTGGAWRLLLILTAIAYVIVDSLSNRTPLTILIEKMTLDPTTAWYRIHIWHYGMLNVWSHPIFGLGLNDWERPDWLTASVDNFWLLNAMRHGIPGFLLLAFSFAFHVYRVVRAGDLSPYESKVRTGYVIALGGIFFTLATVHVWDALAVFIMFYVGAGSFFYTGRPASTPAEEGQPEDGEANNLASRQRRARGNRRKTTASPAAAAGNGTPISRTVPTGIQSAAPGQKANWARHQAG